MTKSYKRKAAAKASAAIGTTSPSAQPLFEIRNMGDKGKGMVALVDLAKGTRIHQESPFMVMSSDNPDLQGSIVRALKSLPRSEQRTFLRLHNSRPAAPNKFEWIFRTNCLPCGHASTYSGVYANLCFVNHSCVPNAHHRFNRTTNTKTLHALRPILAGEEITIAYIDGGAPRAVRRAELAMHFAFVCACPACSLPDAEVAASDERRFTIKILEEIIEDDWLEMMVPDQLFAAVDEYIQTTQEEYGSDDAAASYAFRVATRVAALHGRTSLTAQYATAAYAALVSADGEDNPNTQSMKKYADNPTTYPSFGKYVG